MAWFDCRHQAYYRLQLRFHNRHRHEHSSHWKIWGLASFFTSLRLTPSDLTADSQEKKTRSNYLQSNRPLCSEIFVNPLETKQHRLAQSRSNPSAADRCSTYRNDHTKNEWCMLSGTYLLSMIESHLFSRWSKRRSLEKIKYRTSSVAQWTCSLPSKGKEDRLDHGDGVVDSTNWMELNIWQTKQQGEQLHVLIIYLPSSFVVVHVR